MTTILFTGYEPFGEHETNPSARLAHDIKSMSFESAEVVGRELPVVFDEALPLVVEAIERHDPDYVLSTGLMPGREVISVECVGINVRDYDGVPARVSNTAGTHLCNNILYATRHHVETNDLDIGSGFVHLPFSHAQVARREETDPSMSYDAMRRSVGAMLEWLANG